jgi:hypothetical protein
MAPLTSRRTVDIAYLSAFASERTADAACLAQRRCGAFGRESFRQNAAQDDTFLAVETCGRYLAFAPPLVVHAGSDSKATRSALFVPDRRGRYCGCLPDVPGRPGRSVWGILAPR